MGGFGVNTTAAKFTLGEGLAGTYQMRNSLIPGQEYRIHVEPSGKYREYQCAMRLGDRDGTLITSDDCVENETIEIINEGTEQERTQIQLERDRPSTRKRTWLFRKAQGMVRYRY